MLGQRGGRQRADRDGRLRRVPAAAVRRDADDLHERVAASLLAALRRRSPRPDPAPPPSRSRAPRRRGPRPPRTRRPGRRRRGRGRAPRWRGRTPSRSTTSVVRIEARKGAVVGYLGRFGAEPRAPRAVGERLVVDRIGRGAPDVSAQRNRQLHSHVVDAGRLGRPARGEAQHQRALVRHQCKRSRPRVSGGALRDLEGVHATPTCTSRKRAGAVPWDTRITWPGSPLPQSSREIMCHSAGEQTASQLPQNSGVTPA